MAAIISDNAVKLTYNLLLAKYGNNPIANKSLPQFGYRVCQLIFQYGPTWEKRLDVQRKVRELSNDDIISGTKMIYNTALNPSTDPSTGELTEVTYINSQNTQNVKRGKLEGYALLTDLLKTDVTEEYIGRFKQLFKVFVQPEQPLLFLTNVEESEVDMTPQYDTELFCDIFESSDDFLEYWKESEFYTLTYEE